MINASIDTLPTPANLRRWKCGTNDKLVNIALVQTLWQQRNNESHPQLLQDHVRITEIHMASQQLGELHCYECGPSVQSLQ